MGTPTSKTLLMIAFLIVAATYSVMRRDLNAVYNSATTKMLITVSGDVVHSAGK